MKLKNILVILVMFIIFTFSNLGYVKAEDNNFIRLYICGNKDFGIIESYNAKENVYEGVMPKLYKKLEESTGLNLEYKLDISSKDEEIKNRQVDLVTLVNDESYPEIIDKIKVFSLDKGENIYIGFTNIVDNVTMDTIKYAINHLSNDEREYILFSTLNKEMNDMKYKYDYYIIFSILFMMVFFLIIYIRLIKKRIIKIKSTDEITMYSNYKNFMKKYSLFITESNRQNYCLIDMGVDLSNVKKIYGYDVLEEILKSVATVLDENINDGEMFCRRTSSSFILLMECISELYLEERLVILAERIKNNITKYAFNISYGVYYLRTYDNDLKKASIYAMSARLKSEENGKLYTLCTKEEIENIEKEIFLEKNIIDDIKKGRFISYIQPIFDISDNTVPAVEILARWENEKYGLIKPKQFLQILEKNNLLYDIDIKMFRNACALLQKLKNNDNTILKVFCNFVRTAFLNEDFIDTLKEILVEYNVEANMIGIIITDDIILHNGEYNIKECVKKLKDAGFYVVLDNFGASKESLNDVIKLDCDFLKISPKLLENITTERQKNIIMQIVKLVQEFDTYIICENIKNTEMIKKIRDIGCNYAQGEFFCQAIPLEELLNNNKLFL